MARSVYGSCYRPDALTQGSGEQAPTHLWQRLPPKRSQRMAISGSESQRMARIKTSARLKTTLDTAGGRAPIHASIAASGALLLGSALRLYGLDRQSAWADEITTLLITDPALTFAQFWQLVLSD